MIVFILDKKDEFHFACRLDKLLVDVQKGNELIEFCFGQLNDVKGYV
jgi:hypothetical protein